MPIFTDYLISIDFNNPVDPKALDREIKAANPLPTAGFLGVIKGIDGNGINPDNVRIVSTSSLTVQEKTDLDVVIANHPNPGVPEFTDLEPGDVIELLDDGQGGVKFPAIDGSLLTNLPSSAKYNRGFSLTKDGKKPYVEIKENDYAVVALFNFPGTNSGVNPSKVKVILEKDDGSNTASVRIYDKTNGNVIAESTSISVTNNPKIYDIGSTSNLPSNESIIEIQVKKSSDDSGRIRISSFNLYEE